MFLYRRNKGKAAGQTDLLPDKVRCGPAAASQHMDRELRDLQHLRGELLRGEVIDCLSVLRARKSGVRVDDDRKGTDLCKFL